MHNGKYHTESFKAKQATKRDRLFGPVKIHIKQCERCNNTYEFKGRFNTEKYRKSKFCSRSCANNRQEYWNKNSKQYTTIAWQNWDKKCVVCGFDKIVEIHHYDHNHANNDPYNLMPLCPNHHQMMHSKWRNEIEYLVTYAFKVRNARMAQS